MTDDDPLPQGGCGADVAAHVLGALSEREESRFRAHLMTCSVCSEELVAFTQVVESLAMVPSQYRAPEAVRERVLAEAQHGAPPDGAPPGVSARRRARSPVARLIRPASAVSLMTFIVIAIIGILRHTPPQQTHPRLLNAQVRGGGGSAQVRIASGRAELIIRRLAPPPSGEVYQVWLTRPGRGAIPTTALFNVTAAGSADVEVPGRLRDVKGVMVTPEPAGGTTRPTHPAVIVARLG
jgi:anti-sigma factor RsiW